MSQAETHVRALNNRAIPQVWKPAAAWCLEHPGEAHPVMLEVLAEGGPESKRILSLLPQMGLAEAVPAIAALLDHPIHASSAGNALGLHPDPSALAALVEALGQDSSEARSAALLGLRQRGDDSACEAVQGLVEDPDPVVREAATHTLSQLGC